MKKFHMSSLLFALMAVFMISSIAYSVLSIRAQMAEQRRISAEARSCTRAKIGLIERGDIIVHSNGDPRMVIHVDNPFGEYVQPGRAGITWRATYLAMNDHTTYDDLCRYASAFRLYKHGAPGYKDQFLKWGRIESSN